jgi:hypothetical protein
MTTDIKIKINVEGSEFQDGNMNYEVARILEKLAKQYKEGNSPESINDINGNKACIIEYIEE